VSDPAKQPNKPNVYHVVSYRDGVGLLYEGCPDRHALREALIKLKPGEGGGHVRIWVFAGSRLLTTKPPFPYLIEGGHDPLPLFNPPAPGETDAEGVLTVDNPDEAAAEYAAATAEAMAGLQADLTELDGAAHKAPQPGEEEPLAPEGER
jgi:hypothetical protein